MTVIARHMTPDTAASATKAGLAHAALALGGFAIGTAEFATMGFLPAFSAEFGVDAPAGGHAVSAYALGVVTGAPVLAVLGAVMERRRLLVLLLAWFALGNLLSPLAQDISALVELRFLTAIPHGAYFGTAVLVAVNLATETTRARAVSRILMGLALASTIGAPLAQLLSQALGWRVGFAAIGLLALAAVAGVLRLVPAQAADPASSPLRELGALRRPQMWLSLCIGAIGFGGLFAVYTYLASTLHEVTQAPDSIVPLVLCLFGAGIAMGNFMAPRLARRGVMTAAGIFLIWSASALALYPLSVDHLWSIGLVVFAIGCGGGLGTVLQIRLMDVAGDAQNLAAALNHVAFNTANALGPWLGGLSIAAGLGWESTGWVGCAMALGGLIVWWAAALADNRQNRDG